MRFLFRTDASYHLGSGHVMRCLTLANELKQRGHDCVFLSRELEGNLIEFVRAQNFECQGIGGGNPRVILEPEDARETLGLCEKTEAFDWIIVDHYQLSFVWENKIKQATGCNLLAIDDLANRAHAADALLDQNEYFGKERRYQGLVSEKCKMMLGAGYALLRPDFSEYRSTLLPRSGDIKNILVFFGGSDEKDLTSDALNVLAKDDFHDLKVTVITGSQNRHCAKIEKMVKARRNTTHLTQVDNMAELMGQADLALGASGSTNWERCCLGLPAIVWSVADNQNELLEALAKKGAVLAPAWNGIDDEEILRSHIQTLLHNPLICSSLSNAGLSLCDGRGVSRVCDVLTAPAIELRQAQAEDALLLFDWRNHSSVRSTALTKEPISWGMHKKWFEASRENPNRCLLIAEYGRVPVGVVRFDRNEMSAEVSIYLNPDETGKGLGRPILQRGEEEAKETWPDIQSFTATILDNNVSSLKMFTLSGYEVVQHQFIKQVD